MKLLKEKIEEVIIKTNNLFEENILNEIKVDLLEIQNEIEKYREIEIYREDFSEISWSYVSENKSLRSIITYTNIK